MKYSSVLFDWGDTLAPLNKSGVPVFHVWAAHLIQNLYFNAYRIGIVSNTHRYQDSWWIRNELARRDLLQYFEVVVASANYVMHKPDPAIFRKAIEFMQVSPEKTVMVGDSTRCDGGCKDLGIEFLKVEPDENWSYKLYGLLNDDFDKKRKLSNLFDFKLKDGLVTTKLRHLSESLVAGDRILLDQEEYKVEQCSNFSKDQILKAKDEYIQFKVKHVPAPTTNSIT